VTGRGFIGVFGATKKPPVGRLDEHVGDHVLYEMMMMAAVTSVRIADHSTGPGRDRQSVTEITDRELGMNSRFAGDNAVRTRWTNR
jgi:hypothetical protein